MVRFNNITKYCSVNNFKDIFITDEGFQKMNWYKANLEFAEVRNNLGDKHLIPKKILLYLYKYNTISTNLGWLPFSNPHSVIKIEKDEIVGVGNLDGGYRLIYYDNVLSLTTHSPAFFKTWTDITIQINRNLKLKEMLHYEC